jgi:hypothetical protein
MTEIYRYVLPGTSAPKYDVRFNIITIQITRFIGRRCRSVFSCDWTTRRQSRRGTLCSKRRRDWGSETEDCSCAAMAPGSCRHDSRRSKRTFPRVTPWQLSMVSSLTASPYGSYQKASSCWRAKASSWPFLRGVRWGVASVLYRPTRRAYSSKRTWKAPHHLR